MEQYYDNLVKYFTDNPEAQYEYAEKLMSFIRNNDVIGLKPDEVIALFNDDLKEYREKILKIAKGDDNFEINDKSVKKRKIID